MRVGVLLTLLILPACTTYQPGPGPLRGPGPVHHLGFILLEVQRAAVAVPPLLQTALRNARGTPHPS